MPHSFKLRKLIGGIIFSLCVFFSASHAFAAGTAANTTLQSDLDIDYSVGSTAQTTVSSTQSFVVDQKVNLTVNTTDSAKSATANLADQFVTFTLTNTGNETQGYSLTLTTTDSNSIISGSAAIWIDGGNGTFDNGGADDTAYTSGSGANLGNLAADGAVQIYVEVTTAASAADGQSASFLLRATTLVASSTTPTTDNNSANVAGSVEIVHADAAGDSPDAAYDGSHSDTAGITIASATLAATPTMTVLYDVNSGSDTCATMNTTTDIDDTNPKSIPGACIHFRYVVANTGTTAASSVTFTVDLPAGLTYVGALAGETSDCASYAAPSPAAGGIVSCNMGTISNGADKEISFRVTVD